MNRYQTIALLLALANAIVMGLFHPYDQFSIAASSMPVFSDFLSVFSPPPKAVIYTSLLTIEFLVIGVNFAITWLLLRDSVTPPPAVSACSVIRRDQGDATDL